MKRKCPRCSVEKDYSEFGVNRTKKDGCSTYCKNCRKHDTKLHYSKNINYYKTRNRNREKLIIDWYNQYKSTLSCIRCEENHPACLQFHHRNPNIKFENVSNLVTNGYSKDKILNEISKCDVLCANCHSKEHWDQKHRGEG